MLRRAPLLLVTLLLLLTTAPAGASPGTGDPGHGQTVDGLTAAATQAERTYRYRFDRRGTTYADYDQFRAAVQETLSDRRGWWRSGVTLEPGGDSFTVVLASPQVIASAHPICSAQYSCRVGNSVYINDERWRTGASPFRAGLENYRRYVVNHEVGHWLGLGHRSCSATGAPAPVMLQQSISLQGCTENWWPLDAEIRAVASIHGTTPRRAEVGPTVASWSSDRLDIAALGAGSAVHTRREGGAWTSLGGSGTSDPDLASWGTGRLDLVVRGADGAVWQRAYSSGAWRQWASLGGRTTSGPAAASWGPGRLDVVARGADSALWQRFWNGSAWSGWTSHGGRLGGDPDAASWGPGRLDVVVRGTDGAVWQKAWDGRGWSRWHGLGGSAVGGVAAASRSAGHLQVFARWTDDSLRTRSWTAATGWSPWQSLGGRLASSPDAARRGSTVVVAVRGTDGQLWKRVFDGRWSGWQVIP